MPTVKGDSMRGLAVFISDIRNCKSKEAEIKRINKELANIRSKFKGDKTLDGYQKKKYVCKLLFIFLLGHDIDFGHSEAVNLLCSNKYTEKQIGYLFISVLINESHNLMNLVVQRLKDDLSSRNPVFVTLALQCIANIGTREMTENFAKEIPRLLVSGDTIDSVKQSAALCLLKLIRAAPDLVHFDDWTSRVIHLLNDQHMGVVTAAVSLIESLVKRSPEEYKACVSLAVSRLSRIVTSSYTDLQDYTYYFVPAPWLSVKLLRLLQNYPPPDDAPVRSRLTECLESILSKAQEPPKSKKVQHSNAKNAVLFEAINLIIHMDCDPNLLVRACNQLGQFLSHRETNLRYLALESMCLLATSEFSHEAVKKHQETVISALKSERDVSVRQRAVDLLYAMCDRNNAEEIVGEMLSYLESADYSIREEMVLKVAILSEKYATDYSWYVDTILNLIRVAGDYVSEEVWHRVIQIVINRDDVQGYAAKTVFEALQAPACHENMVKVGGYILGEFGNLIAGDPRSSPQIQFQILHAKYHLCTPATRQLLLSTYVKFINLFPEIKDEIQDILKNDSNLRNSDVEIQQRTMEYLTLSKIATDDVMATVLEEMPPFPERESSILAKLKQKKPAAVEGQETVTPRQHPTAKISKNLNDTQNEEIPAKDENVQEVDLLGGFSTFSTFSQTNQVNKPVSQPDSDLLLDILGNGFGSDVNENKFSNEFNTSPVVFEQSDSDENYLKLLWKSSGILFENDKIQIGIKSEFRGHMGRLGIFYGNKSLKQMTHFTTELQNCPSTSQLKLDLNPLKPEIASGEQEQQRLNIECFQAFDQLIILKVCFSLEKQLYNITLNLPIALNKFIESAIMEQNTFFQRWKVLCQPGQECQSVINPTKLPIDLTALQAKLEGLNLSVLPNIDPVASNLVASGIVNMSSQKVGVLLRLEPNLAAKVYRLTVRSTKDIVSRKIFKIIESLL